MRLSHTNAAHKSTRRSAACATGSVGLWRGVPVLSCLLYYRLSPGVGSRARERTRVSLKGRSVRAIILIDMLSGHEYFAPVPVYPEWLRTCLLPTPYMCLQRWVSVCGPRPPSGRPAASQVDPRSPPGGFNCMISLT